LIPLHINAVVAECFDVTLGRRWFDIQSLG